MLCNSGTHVRRQHWLCKDKGKFARREEARKGQHKFRTRILLRRGEEHTGHQRLRMRFLELGTCGCFSERFTSALPIFAYIKYFIIKEKISKLWSSLGCTEATGRDFALWPGQDEEAVVLQPHPEAG